MPSTWSHEKGQFSHYMQQLLSSLFLFQFMKEKKKIDKLKVRAFNGKAENKPIDRNLIVNFTSYLPRNVTDFYPVK